MPLLLSLLLSLSLLSLALHRRPVRRLTPLLRGRMRTAHPASPLTLDRRSRTYLLLGIWPDARRIGWHIPRAWHEPPRRKAGPWLLWRISRRGHGIATLASRLWLGRISLGGETALAPRLVAGMPRGVLAALWGRHAVLR